MYRVYMPESDRFEIEYMREWNANAAWRLAGMGIMLCSAIATTMLYIHLAKMALAAFAA
jgi:hypothetical protein